MRLVFTAFIFCCLFSSVVSAREWRDDVYFYAGASIGFSVVDYKYPGLSILKEESPLVSLNGGVAGFKHFSLELDYRDHGSIQGDVATRSGPPFITNDELKLSSVSVLGVASLVVGDNLSVIGKLGYANWQVKDVFAGTFKDDDSGADIVYGLGLAFDMNQRLTIICDYQHLAIEPRLFGESTRLQANSWSLGLRVSF